MQRHHRIGALFGVIALMGILAVSYSTNSVPRLARLKFKQNRISTTADLANFKIPKDNIGVFGLPDDAAATDLGVGWTRIPIQWKEFEDNRQMVENHINALTNTKVLVTLRAVNADKTNCLLDTAAIVAGLETRGITLRADIRDNPEDFISCYPDDMNQYKAFVHDIVQSNIGKVDVWQIENEVYNNSPQYWSGDNQGEFTRFIAMYKAASQEIKSVDPTAKVMVAGVASNHSDFLADGTPQPSNSTLIAANLNTDQHIKELLSQACSNIDVFDVHLYHTVESIPGRIKHIQNIMQEANCSKPIWSTEISGPDPFPPNTITTDFSQRQADELAPRLNAAIDAGLQKVIYYTYKDNPAATTDSGQQNLGLFTDNGVKKPAYNAFKQVVSTSQSLCTPNCPPPQPNSLYIDPATWQTNVGDNRLFSAHIVNDQNEDITSQYAITWSIIGPQTVRISSIIGSSISATATSTGDTTLVATVAGTTPPLTKSVPITTTPPVDTSVYQTNLRLASGWNLIALPQKIVGRGGPIFTDQNVFAWNGTTYDNLTIDGGIPSSGQAFWVNAQNEGNLVLRNTASHSQNVHPTQIVLNIGWNMVGNPYETSLPITSIQIKNGAQSYSLTQAINDRLISGDYTYSPSARQYAHVANQSTPLNPGEGMWIFARTEGLSIIFN